MQANLVASATRAFAVLTLMSALIVAAFPQKRSRIEAPSVSRIAAKSATAGEKGVVSAPSFSGSGPFLFSPPNDNPSCATLNGLNADPRFAFIASDWELRITLPTTESVAFTPTSRVELLGGLPANAQQSIAISFAGSTTMNSFALSAPQAIYNRKVTAVIVGGGTQGSNVYTYPSTGIYSDQGPFSLPLQANGSPQTIFHLSFCLDEAAAPSAAPVSVNGRVLTSFGRSISRAAVTAQNLNTGESKIAYTNSFGYYRLEGLTASDLYVVSVSARGYSFSTNSYSLTLNQSAENVNFIAN